MALAPQSSSAAAAAFAPAGGAGISLETTATNSSLAVDPNVPPAGQAGWYPLWNIGLNDTHSMAVNVANGN